MRSRLGPSPWNFVLALSMCGWHSSNLLITLHGLLGLGGRGTSLLRAADTLAVISITFAYSFLLHVHLYLWANTRKVTRHGRPKVPGRRTKSRSH